MGVMKRSSDDIIVETSPYHQGNKLKSQFLYFARILTHCGKTLDQFPILMRFHCEKKNRFNYLSPKNLAHKSP